MMTSKTRLPQVGGRATMKSMALLLLLVPIVLTNTAAASSLEATTSKKSVTFAPSHRRRNTNIIPSSSIHHNHKQHKMSTAAKGSNGITTIRGGDNILSSEMTKQISGVIIFTLIDIYLRKTFKAKNIMFPSMLAGSCLLFALMVILDALKDGLGDSLFQMISPGAGLLAKWMSVFFLPALATLPLAPKIGSTLEIVKVICVTVLGFLFTLGTSAFTSLAVRNAQGAIVEIAKEDDESTETSSAPAPPKPYSEEILSFLIKGFVISAAISLGATLTDNAYATPLQTIFFLFATVGSFVWGARLPSEVTKVIHPLVTGTAFTLIMTKVIGSITGSTFTDVLRSYKAGTMQPMKTGAGDILLFLLGPAIVSLSTAMYSRRKLLAENFVVLMTTELVTTFGGLYGTAAFVRLINLGNGANGEGSAGVLRLSCIPRMITTALAMAASDLLGGNTSITASIVVLTGIIGATFGGRILTAWGINDPVSRGIGIGAAAQGLGVASFLNEKDAFPFAAIMMVLTAVCVTSAVSIPFVIDSLRKIATGA